MSNTSFKQAILNKRMLICIFTGFSSGLPLFVLYQLVPGWLRDQGVSLAEIGLFSLIGIPYVWKFIWSPLIDRYSLGGLGRRRSWMLATQLLLLGSIAAFGWLNPVANIWSVAYLAAAVAFFSASQDIVLDAYRRELLPDNELGLGNSIHVQAYRLSGLVPGSLAFILADHISWQSVFMIVAAFMVVGVLLTLFIKELDTEQSAPKSLKDAVILPFKDFIQSNGFKPACYTLAFLVLYKLGDNMATALQTPFFIDMGFSKTEIGVIAKTSSLIAMTVGIVVGGLVMIKVSINRALWLFGFVQIASILGFAALAEIGHNNYALAIAMGFEYLGVGLGTAAFTAFIARTTNPAFAATQIALFTALAVLPRTFANATTGFIVEQIGWTQFYFLCTALAVPGMLMLLKVAPWHEVVKPIKTKKSGLTTNSSGH
ncbi:AmpG family muropeptide MFS transporter [Colwellia sp. 4_MG-2023]|jgi:PAT family beta-lactamase induction signal transducer AmpG|uniref:AmpG family muropeptide MFS transporter n=1 Tax=unclassified Colwellia TaxID=196834 RepID=UPI001C09D002|nr:MULTISPECIES: AmpG family muropeptide MFS transporter [unclassified Colwellia]MBU2925174.1 AmpG family muropeptide MFS transporter [Colwellia sp. C2M11]MDO6486673.1 AmpG family muropeptide MFS transporter [Colwellia sp. 6_MG-2023]MDO6506742.1 AmpG family muropeptide MFS transporter [Colwellia sp. 5_MG-2023]MDO6555568.1 AmpG family muropeptide MFS transporter [Colwellia sp. 4_MG-2023]MDO6651301.1 AmpG family muropeptide MFS transporter [Colwellia sp. 3_MG-2023]